MAQAGNIIDRNGMRGTQFQAAVTKGVVVISTTFGQAILPTASGQAPFGVVEKDCGQYEHGEVVTKGKAIVRCSEAVAYGAYVSVGNTSGYVKNAYPGEPLVGKCVLAGTTAGDYIEVELMLGQACPNGYATANVATYDVPANVNIIGVQYTATGAAEVELQTARLAAGQTLFINDLGGNANNNNITITTQGAETINGADTATISAAYGGLTVYSDGTNWFAF